MQCRNNRRHILGKATEKDLIIFKRMLKKIFSSFVESLMFLIVSSYGNGNWCLVFFKKGCVNFMGNLLRGLKVM